MSEDQTIKNDKPDEKSDEKPKKEYISSKVNLKPYFLPIYLIWALIIPTGLVLLNAYRQLTDETALTDHINWQTVPAMYALYGLVFPMMLVTFKAFYLSFIGELGFESFGDAWKSLPSGDPKIADNAMKSVILVILVTLLWVGPIGHLAIAFYFHKNYIDLINDKKQSWSDYFYGFI